MDPHDLLLVLLGRSLPARAALLTVGKPPKPIDELLHRLCGWHWSTNGPPEASATRRHDADRELVAKRRTYRYRVRRSSLLQ